MDLKLLDAEPTPEERAAIDAALAPLSPVGAGGVFAKRHLLLPALEAAQARVGWISEGAFTYICATLEVAPAEAYGVMTFYALLATAPRARRIVHVCDDIACKAKGADALIAELERSAGPPAHHVPEGNHVVIGDDDVAWLPSPCLGLCDQAPAAFVQIAGEQPVELLFGDVGLERLRAAMGGALAIARVPRPRLPQAGDPSLRLLRRVDVIDPTSIDAYRAHGGYEALRIALDIGPEGVVREVTDAKLMGRGGAAFPTGRKWDAVAKQAVHPHYLICNADESEPGTFKDRAVMEGDPFSLVEAMTIAGYATAANFGYIYLRGEYPLAYERLSRAIEVARNRGLLGDDVMGSGFAFDLEIRKGAGAYICGEETAIFNSIEGYRGEPRNKPPFTVQSGVFRKPTAINNVETLVNVLEILRIGGPAYAAIGTEGSTGPKLFCLSGFVNRPGVYEVPFGTTLRDMIDLAGGVSGTGKVRAVLLGGAAGVFVGPDELDIPLTFEGVRAAKATLGSGVIMVFDDSVDMLPMLQRIAAFFRDESCGQCVPCRVGTVRQEEALARVVAGKARGGVKAEISLLDEVGLVMKDASICGLGQTAYSALESAIHRLGLLEERGT
ncbi:MAG TPA: NAD(P)H-dependent oxidoreductase subunit E [Candidatus Elarobacter sp.]|nr:NAD(P)H-dependent oxidoreductase subunit E [Candidatus Elarobacter sp.]